MGVLVGNLGFVLVQVMRVLLDENRLKKNQGRMVRKFPGVENGVYGVSGVAKCSKTSKTLRISTFLPFLPDFQGLQGLQGLQLNTPLVWRVLGVFEYQANRTKNSRFCSKIL